jgi:nucleoside-diphosphate-sugar epimerase
LSKKLPHSILVTGGCGFVGRHLVRKMATNYSVRIIIIDNFSNGDDSFINEIALDRSGSTFSHGSDDDMEVTDIIHVYREDIRNERALFEIIKDENVKFCVHLAAKTSVQESIANPHEVLDVNVGGTLNVIRACCNNNVTNLVFASSAAVYGNGQPQPLVEDLPLRPVSPYGVTKVAGEALMSAYSDAFKYSFSLRFFNIYGEGQKGSIHSGVISNFVKRITEGLPVIVYGDGNQTRDFVYVGDVVKSIMLALDPKTNAVLSHKSNASQVLNIGTGKCYTINRVIYFLQNAISSSTPIRKLIEKPHSGDTLQSCPNIQRARHSLGYEPSVDLQEGLASLLKPLPTSRLHQTHME